MQHCMIIGQAIITGASQHLKSLAIRLFVQQIVQASGKEIINVLHYLCKDNPPITGGFLTQRYCNTQNVSVSWHHENKADMWSPNWTACYGDLFCLHDHHSFDDCQINTESNLSHVHKLSIPLAFIEYYIFWPIMVVSPALFCINKGEYCIFLHDLPWISPWIKSICNELDIIIHVIASQLSGHCDVISNRLWRHQQKKTLSEWDMGTICKNRRFHRHLWIRYVM